MRGSTCRHIDAANIDLKAFTDAFYEKVTFAKLPAVLDTLEFLADSDVWLEITTLLIPGHNDSDAEIAAECEWLLAHLGPDVPLHFTAFHPDFKMRDVPPTPPATLSRARRIALDLGLRYVYTGNVHDPDGQTTTCPGCGAAVIVRGWYVIEAYALGYDGRCRQCLTPVPGVSRGRSAPGGRGGCRCGWCRWERCDAGGMRRRIHRPQSCLFCRVQRHTPRPRRAGNP